MRRTAPLILCAAACVSADPSATSGGTGGGKVGAFCDDDNPCTVDANCTPCSSLPPEQRDIYHCTEDTAVPSWCITSGCAHMPVTTPDGQVNDCFPVSDADPLRAGVCRNGACVDNP